MKVPLCIQGYFRNNISFYGYFGTWLSALLFLLSRWHVMEHFVGYSWIPLQSTRVPLSFTSLSWFCHISYSSLYFFFILCNSKFAFFLVIKFQFLSRSHLFLKRALFLFSCSDWIYLLQVSFGLIFPVGFGFWCFFL